MPRKFTDADFSDNAPMGKRKFTDEDFTDSPQETPSMFSRFKSGFMEKDIPQPKGFERGDVAEFAGRQGLETLGGTIMTPFGPGAIALGAGAGKAAHEGIRRAIGAFNPGSTEMGSDLGVIGKVGGEALIQGAGAKYLPPVAKAIGSGISKTAGAIGRKVISPILRGTTGVSKKAFDALIRDSETILKNSGLSPDDIVAKGQDLQDMISYGKEGIETSSRKILAKRSDALKYAGGKISEHADYLKSKAVEAGQELQSRIGAIKDKAGAEYKAAIDKILGSKSRKYGLDPGAAYPYTVDLHNPLSTTIKNVRTKFGYDLPGRVADESETAIFNKFQNVINNMDNASVDEVYWLQRDLRHAMDLNKGKPISSALGSLRAKVLDVLEERVPEIRPANQGYRAAMEMADELSGLESADAIANQVHQAFKYGGNKQDSILKFAGVDKEANKIVQSILKNMDDHARMVEKGKTIQGLASKVDDLATTYKLGESKNVMLRLAEKDATIKSFLGSVADKEEVYKNLGSIMEGDNIGKQVVKIMSEGGNKKDSLMELARTNPQIGDKVAEIQNAIFGSEFSPWIREIPQTGMGRGILFGGGALAATAPAAIASAPLFSPRLVGKAVGATIKGTSMLERGAQSIPIERLTPGLASSTEELMRKHYEAQK